MQMAVLLSALFIYVKKISLIELKLIIRISNFVASIGCSITASWVVCLRDSVIVFKCSLY